MSRLQGIVPRLVLRKEPPSPICVVDKSECYCSTCDQRLQACDCFSPEAAYRVDPVTWTRAQALELVGAIEDSLDGWHVALTGSILYRGYSDNDLDIILYPSDASRVDISEATSALESLGLKRLVSRAAVAWKWAKGGSTDTKHVEKVGDSRQQGRGHLLPSLILLTGVGSQGIYGYTLTEHDP